MYEALDTFLNHHTTWSSRHENDQERFFCAIKPLVEHPDFNPDLMGEYMRRKAEGTLEAQALDREIRYYVAAAWAVRRYLRARC
jgi:hypothetical protein